MMRGCNGHFLSFQCTFFPRKSKSEPFLEEEKVRIILV